ncbi:hypothetical protein [Paucibacter sp. Y2R2-4]|uniref:hypothetical protein n=1 Tax=Paucibacter sp. Y2R2-4 TaxID=2893553 RepID=UPI0021E46828|nr:hypothetical protein [Paucibacter sp. Y2R2-4]MCV2349094.1 hypothetical protein [Paucibacter sp. Y2R2-4]
MSARPDTVIHIHPEAPTKPAEGQTCNGCGICCLSEPCPIGVLVSRKRRGACKALQWSALQKRYVCGMLAEPLPFIGWRKPSSFIGRRLSRALARACRRWIAAGIGCDSDLEAVAPSDSGQATRSV